MQNEKIGDSGSLQVDADKALNVFQIGLLPFIAKHTNYLGMITADGAKRYSDERIVTSRYFGETWYADKISNLHIDSNHT